MHQHKGHLQPPRWLTPEFSPAAPVDLPLGVKLVDAPAKRLVTTALVVLVATAPIALVPEVLAKK
jgi:hypothetical protein